ncbi:MAG: phospholipase D family protein [Acidobacteria bacterium]|nr:phospholipase D family protein [Acidobacteriota bacterium]
MKATLRALRSVRSQDTIRRLRGAVVAMCLLSLGGAARPASADSVRLLKGAADAAEARARLVVEAKEEILAAYFIVGDDPFSMTALALLRDAARRGVRVRLMVDAQWNKIPGNVQAHLLREGVDLRVYHPFRLLRPGWITRRLHDKLLIVDGKYLLTGGRNVESPYFDLGRQIRRRDYLDCDVLLEGETAEEARSYFEELWESDHVRLSSARNNTERLAEAARELDRHQAWIEGRIEAHLEGLIEETLTSGSPAPPPAEPPGPVEVAKVRFLHDPVAGKGRGRGVGHELRDLLDEARSEVLIESPYLVPSRSVLAAIDRALSRGVHIRILTNSLASTDNLFPQAGYVRRRKDLVRRGVELWEYTGPATLHAKNAVIDGHRLIVGSYNLDPRSEHLNTETALVFDSPPLAARLLAEQQAHLADSVQIDPRGWPTGATEPFPSIPRWKRCKLRLVRMVAGLIEGQL